MIMVIIIIIIIIIINILGHGLFRISKRAD
jgi:hypothetical protein